MALIIAAGTCIKGEISAPPASSKRIEELGLYSANRDDKDLPLDPAPIII